MLYIIVFDYIMKMSLEFLFFGLGFKNINFVIFVEDKYLIFELSKIGVYLYGVKFVYVNMGVEVFYIDECFVIMGSLM